MTKFIFSLFLLLPLCVSNGAADGAGTIPQPEFQRVMFIGNSLTRHQPLASIDWTPTWGMAATQPDRDYVHRVQLGITARQGSIPEIFITRADIPFPDADLSQKIRAFDPDLIIIQMGNNAATWTPIDDWRPIYQQIASATKGQIIVVGLWAASPDDIREMHAMQMATEISAGFVPIWDIYSDATNGIADGIYTHPGILWHPGDAGMALIANRILDKLYSSTIYASLIMSQK